MKESYSEDPASHTGPELYAGDGNIAGVATTGVHAGEVLSPEKRNSRVPTLSGLWEGHIVPSALASRGRTRRGRRPYACMETPSARTGRSYWFPATVSEKRPDNWNGQKTPQVVPLT